MWKDIVKHYQLPVQKQHFTGEILKLKDKPVLQLTFLIGEFVLLGYDIKPFHIDVACSLENYTMWL